MQFSIDKIAYGKQDVRVLKVHRGRAPGGGDEILDMRVSALLGGKQFESSFRVGA